MPHGQPDFGMYAVKETVSGLADIGELAVRLGSIVTFDRRGDVYWFDDFEDDITKWMVGGDDATYEVVWSPVATHKGAFSIELKAGSGGSYYAYMRKYAAPIPLTRLGFECWYTINSNSEYIDITIGRCESGEVTYGTLRLKPATRELQYEDSKGNYQTFKTLASLETTVYHFAPMKLVIDLVTGKYVRALFLDKEYDLSSYSLRTASTAAKLSTWMQIYHKGEDGTNRSIYVDNVILTQNEP